MRHATQYTAIHPVARQLGSAGCSRLVFPIKRLLEQFVVWMARDLVVQLRQATDEVDQQREREAADLGDECLSLAEWFTNTSRSTVEWNGRQQGLRKLAALADDLASDTGSWRDGLESHATVSDEAAGEIARRLTQQLEHLHRNHGDKTAQEFCKLIVQELRRQHSRLLRDHKGWTSSDRERLQTFSQLLRQAATLRGWRKVVLTYWPNVPLRWLLTKRRCDEIQRVRDGLIRDRRRREESLVMEAKRQTYDRLIGKHGRLSAITRPLNEFRTLLNSLDSLLTVPADDAVHPGGQVLLVDSLATIVEPDPRTTVKDLFVVCCREAGVKMIGMVDHIRREGLSVADDQVSVSEWTTVPAQDIAQALLAYVRHTLGVADPDVVPNVGDPQTAFDRIAGLTPVCDELRSRLMQVLPEFVNRSTPYIEFAGAAGVDVLKQATVFCHVSQHRLWQKLLRHHVELTAGDEPYGCSIENPWIVELRQEIYAGAAGAARQIWRYFSQANRACRQGIVEPLFDRHSACERRLLCERLRDAGDCESLFAAGLKAGVLYALPHTANYALALDDRRINDLFAPPKFVPRWRTPEFFQQRLAGDSQFRSFLERTCPGRTDLRALLAELSREPEADLVAKRLLELDVLESRVGQFRMRQELQLLHADRPRGLYERHPGETVGLDRDACLAQLLRNDWFYTILFCRVLDHFELGRLSENDVPPSIVEMSRSLQ